MFFDLCRTENGKISAKAFLEELVKFGIYSDDPRLKHIMDIFNRFKPKSASSIDDLALDSQIFRTVMSENIVLVNKALQNSFIISDFESFTDDIGHIFEKVPYYIVLRLGLHD